MHIEHIIPEREPVIYEGYNSDIDVKNMIGVCAGNRTDSDNDNKHCDSSRGGTEISITPYDKTIMSSIKYLRDGSIYSTDPRIDNELNDLLHLNSNRNSLKQNRMTAYKKLRDMVQYKSNGKTIKKAQLEKIRNQFCSKDTDGIYMEYVGVFEYWLNKWERKSNG